MALPDYKWDFPVTRHEGQTRRNERKLKLQEFIKPNESSPSFEKRKLKINQNIQSAA
jgi:hypothetical protein